jgi:hypothetical protein
MTVDYTSETLAATDALESAGDYLRERFDTHQDFEDYAKASTRRPEGLAREPVDLPAGAGRVQRY